jgi:hypothetical protein
MIGANEKVIREQIRASMAYAPLYIRYETWLRRFADKNM